MSKNEDIDFDALEAIANDAAHIQTKTETEEVDIFKKKNVLVGESWIQGYANLPEPKPKFNVFCSLAIKEKLEKEGIIAKKTT